MAGIGLSAIMNYIYDQSRMIRIFSKIILSCVLILACFVLANGITNGRIQVAIDSSNKDLIDFLALHVPVNGTVLVNLQEANEYVFEIGVHLAALKQRQDIRLRYFYDLDFEADAGAFAVTPIMKNEPIPTVRSTMYEGVAKIWKSELLAKLGSRGKLVDQKAKRVQLLMIALETPICPVLMWADIPHGFNCGGVRPVIDTRIFTYGWEVYRIL
jgi:hypothetical protein